MIHKNKPKINDYCIQQYFLIKKHATNCEKVFEIYVVDTISSQNI